MVAKRTGGAPQRADAPVHGVAIVGAGRMGADIALAFARAGWTCDVVEPDAATRERVLAYWDAELRRLRARRAARRLRLHENLDAVDWPRVELAIEAVYEDLALKHRVLPEIEARAPRKAIIVTNTSSLLISEVTRVLEHGGRSAGLHFMLPAHVTPAVEVTKGERTAPATMKRLVAWMKAIGKVPVVLNRDVPGMLINRIQHAMYREIYHLIDSGIVDARDVDLAVRFSFGFRYHLHGPVVSRDINGVPVHLAVARQIYPTLYNGTEPPKVLLDLVAQGRTGVRSGHGFYRWDPKTVDARLARFTELLEQGLRRVKRMGEPTEF